MKRVFFILPVLFLFTLSCRSTQKTQTVQEKTKFQFTKDVKWVMTSFHGKAPAEAGFKQKTPYVVIDKEAGSISGNSGCNSFSGKAELSNNSLKAGRIASTKAFCMGVPENEFFTDLSEMSSYRIDGDKLLFLKGDDVLMEFKAEQK